MTGACTTAQKAYHEFDPRPKPADAAFTAVVKKYLKEGSIHTGAATELLVQVLPANWEVRAAWVERRAVAFAWTPAQKAKDLADQKAEYAKYLTVLGSVYTPDAKWNNLGEQEANWRVYLVNAKGQRLEPVDVRRIKKRSAINAGHLSLLGFLEPAVSGEVPAQGRGRPALPGPERKNRQAFDRRRAGTGEPGVGDGIVRAPRKAIAAPAPPGAGPSFLGPRWSTAARKKEVGKGKAIRSGRWSWL